MKTRYFSAGLALVGLVCASALSQVVAQIGPGGAVWGGGMGGWQFTQFMYAVAQLNMTPDFTLDKEAKTKLAGVNDEWQKANTKFMADNKEEFQRLGKEQMEAWKAKDQEKIKQLSKDMQDLYAKGPKAEEYIDKAREALSHEQRNQVDQQIEQQKQAMQGMQIPRGGAGGAVIIEEGGDGND